MAFFLVPLPGQGFAGLGVGRRPGAELEVCLLLHLGHEWWSFLIAPLMGAKVFDRKIPILPQECSLCAHSVLPAKSFLIPAC